MAKDDLRYQRTEKYLWQAFQKAIAEKPLDKISVTALAREAEINKATFYLHYRDVRDMGETWARRLAEDDVAAMDFADKLLDDPDTFVRGFMEFSERNHERAKRMVRDGLQFVYINQLRESMQDRLRASFTPSNDLDREIATHFLLFGMVSAPTVFPNQQEEATRVISNLPEGMSEHLPRD